METVPVLPQHLQEGDPVLLTVEGVDGKSWNRLRVVDEVEVFPHPLLAHDEVKVTFTNGTIRWFASNEKVEVEA